MPFCFWITKKVTGIKKKCDKERIYSYIYSYIPLDSSQYNVLCIISSIHVKSIQNLLASSSEIWYIQLNFKIISFLYYIISTVLLQHTHWNPECTTGFIFIYDCSRKEIKQNRWKITFGSTHVFSILPAAGMIGHPLTWPGNTDWQTMLSLNQLAMFAHCDIIKRVQWYYVTDSNWEESFWQVQ